MVLDRERLGQIVHEVRIEYEKCLASRDPSRLVPWENLSEWEKDLDRQIGERVAQSVLSENNYALRLSSIEQRQIIYNGKFSYLRNYIPRREGWCHLLVLRSKNKYSKQLLVIATQTPDCYLSIVNAIEHVATFVVNFFETAYAPLEDGDEELHMTPENTTFVESLPAGCFGDKSSLDMDTYAVMEFDWGMAQLSESSFYHRATNPQWHGTSRDTINDLIERL